MMVNIDLRHQYGISVAEGQTSPQRDVPSGEEQGETAVFAGYRPWILRSLKLCANGRITPKIGSGVTCCVRSHPLLHVVRCCWQLLRKVWNRSNFWANTPNISFVPWSRSVKRSATMLDPFAQLFQHCWGHACALHMCTPKSYGLFPSHDAPRVPTLLGVVASVCTPLSTCTQQHPALLAQLCLALLRPFALSLIRN